LLATTEKYLSNLTVRQPGFDADQLAFDAHGIRLEEVAPDSATVLETGQEWELDPGTRRLWIELREKSGVRLSGVQPKLPVGLRREGNELTLALGDLRAPCTHLLKLQSPMYGQLVENEWATMELARQAGLPVPTVRQVEITGEGKRGELALLVERYDIPDSTALEQGGPELRLMLQEDACSLLLLRRARKYEPSLERIADALIAGGLPMDGMETLLRHVAFSWIVGNGDLHAKNISVLRHMVPGRLGRAPRASALTYAPPYDLVCTRLPLRDDEFALPLSGKRNNLRVRDFSAWVERWSMSRERTRTVLEQTVARVQEHLPAVLERSRLPTDEAARYAEVVRRNVERLGL
jgi:serine/threonine-protein kinase HipA